MPFAILDLMLLLFNNRRFYKIVLYGTRVFVNCELAELTD